MIWAEGISEEGLVELSTHQGMPGGCAAPWCLVGDMSPMYIYHAVILSFWVFYIHFIATLYHFLD